MNEKTMSPRASDIASDLSNSAVDVLPISIENLRYNAGGAAIIKSTSMTFADVPCTAVVGHNGAGKSVLLRLMHGLLTPTQGEIYWGAERQRYKSDAMRDWQAMVFQKPVLLRRSVAANLRFVLKRQGLSRGAVQNALQQYLEIANLKEAAHRPASVLSGGEAQRLAIARALATKPEILFLDEPTASLDPTAKASVEALLQRVMQHGVRLILVTQDIGQAARLATNVVVMDNGEIAETGSATQILSKPRSPAARAFLNHEID
ncbi:MAG: ATP-binding cassette domain-containing protein [Pseudomonadota bacterium]